MSEILDVDAWEVLDSRGEPTVRVAVETESNRGVFTVPAGASTGTHEAVERRDGDDRFGGSGVADAVEAVRRDLASVVVGRDVHAWDRIDEELVERDGTPDLSRLGANAILGVSGAVVRAASRDQGVSPFAYLAPDEPGRIPLPMTNMLSGGLHARGGVEIQDFLVIPTGAETYTEALETLWAVRNAIRERILRRGHRPLVADEGGFSPPLDGIDSAFELLTSGVRDAGFEPALDEVAFAVDVAATHFYEPAEDRYVLAGRRLDREAMIDLVEEWAEAYPLVSIEDPLAEDDWDGWARLAERLDDEVQLLGDDLLVTNAGRLERAIDGGVVDAVLVKPNQAGTISRAVDVIETAKAADVAPVVSARSGETCDTTIADLAVGTDAGQIKIGSLCRSERLAKYNRLLEIDRVHDGAFATGGDSFGPW